MYLTSVIEWQYLYLDLNRTKQKQLLYGMMYDGGNILKSFETRF